jgi:hypothetical protein
MVDWRGAAYTASFPTQILVHLRSFAEGYSSDPEPNTGTLRFADAVLKKLSHGVPELTADPQLQRTIRQKVVDLTAEIKDAQSRVSIELPIDKLWKQYLAHHVYRITLWSTLRICYVAIYNAYDNFAQRCTSVAHNGENIRTTNHERFKAKFSEAFGATALQKCWTSPDVTMASRARNALSHASGRAPKELLENPHNFQIEDGIIHIRPSDIKEVYSILKDSAFVLCEAAKDKGEFR